MKITSEDEAEEKEVAETEERKISEATPEMVAEAEKRITQEAKEEDTNTKTAVEADTRIREAKETKAMAMLEGTEVEETVIPEAEAEVEAEPIEIAKLLLVKIVEMIIEI